METAIAFGGWVSPHLGTGNSPSLTRVVGWASAALLATLAEAGTGSELQFRKFPEKLAHAYAHGTDIIEATVSRNPAEDLARIREVLSPAVSELASTLGVTRQSIYNWLNGEPVAEENAAKLHDLAQAADVLAHEGVTVNSTLLKRKFANGRTLFQVAQAGESARDAAAMLLQVLRHEAQQRERIAARFTGRPKTAATADFDLPPA